MKIGDRLICKKDFVNVSSEKLLSIGKSYIVESTYVTGVMIKTNIDFSIPLHYEHIGDLYVWNYFYNEKEVRKLKLESLCGTNL